MRNFDSNSSVCRYCGCYTPEGRRGGYCQQLDVPVQGEWKSCPLAIPPFAPTWEALIANCDSWDVKVLPLSRSHEKEAVPVSATMTDAVSPRSRFSTPYSSSDVA
ncbi:MAG: hypothetical protein ACTS2F_01800 [Thainema sp.]